MEIKIIRLDTALPCGISIGGGRYCERPAYFAYVFDEGEGAKERRRYADHRPILPVCEQCAKAALEIYRRGG